MKVGSWPLESRGMCALAQAGVRIAGTLGGGKFRRKPEVEESETTGEQGPMRVGNWSPGQPEGEESDESRRTSSWPTQMTQVAAQAGS